MNKKILQPNKGLNGKEMRPKLRDVDVSYYSFQPFV